VRMMSGHIGSKQTCVRINSTDAHAHSHTAICMCVLGVAVRAVHVCGWRVRACVRGLDLIISDVSTEISSQEGIIPLLINIYAQYVHI
jgi:hypothetical protein